MYGKVHAVGAILQTDQVLCLVTILPVQTQAMVLLILTAVAAWVWEVLHMPAAQKHGNLVIKVIVVAAGYNAETSQVVAA